MLEPHCRGWQTIVTESTSNEAAIVGEECKLDTLSLILRIQNPINVYCRQGGAVTSSY
jgi:hypothetical protein